MNYVSMHVNYEKDLKIGVGEETGEFNEVYRPLRLGDYTTIFMTNEQLEELFDKLDTALHTKTYSQMQDENINLEIDISNANETIEQLEDKLQEIA